MCVTSSGFESILEPAQANAGFYSKPPRKHSSKIALAIATSATTIKAKEMCSSESSEKQPKKKNRKKAGQKGNGGRAELSSSGCFDCPDAREGDTGSPGLGAGEC